MSAAAETASTIITDSSYVGTSFDDGMAEAAEEDTPQQESTESSEEEHDSA